MTTDTLRALLLAADDSASQAILEAIETDAKSAKEISAECDVPLSTTYRKLEQLHDAGLVEQKIRVCDSGHHTNVYVENFDCVLVRKNTNGRLDVELVRDALELQSPVPPWVDS